MKIGTCVTNKIFGDGVIVKNVGKTEIVVVFGSNVAITMKESEITINENIDKVFQEGYDYAEDRAYEVNPYENLTMNWLKWKAGFELGMKEKRKITI